MAITDQAKMMLEEFGVQLQTDLIESLKKNQHTGSGGQSSKLAGTMQYTVFGKEQSLFFEFSMADYGNYIDAGTRGAKVRGTGGKKMKDSILEWMEGKNMTGNFALNIYRSKLKNPNKSKVSFEKAENSLAWAIKKKINKKGIIKRFGYKGSNWFSDVINDGRIDKLADNLSELFGREVVINLEL